MVRPTKEVKIRKFHTLQPSEFLEIVPSTSWLRQGLLKRTLKSFAPNLLYKEQNRARGKNPQSWGLMKSEYLPNEISYVKTDGIDVIATKYHPNNLSSEIGADARGARNERISGFERKRLSRTNDASQRLEDGTVGLVCLSCIA